MAISTSFIAFLAVIGTIGFEVRQGLISKPQPRTITGVVYETQQHTPLQHVHAYIKDGEEEALTSNKGHFTIRTYEKGPVTIHFRHPHFNPLEVKSTEGDRPLKVYIRRK